MGQGEKETEEVGRRFMVMIEEAEATRDEAAEGLARLAEVA